MKKHRILLVFTALLLLLSCLSGCGQTANPATETDSTVATTAATLVFAKNGEENCFPVIRSEKAENSAIQAAVRLCREIENAVGTRPAIYDDFVLPGTTPAEHEILVGNTAREQSSKCPEELLPNDYFIGVIEGKICIIGGSDAAVSAGVDEFIAAYVTGKTECSVPSDLSKVCRSEMQTYAIGDITDSLKILGRYSMDGKGLCCDLSATGIEFCADCEGDITVKIQALSSDVYFSVFVDGVRRKDRLYVQKSKTETLTVCEELEKGEHSVRIVKDSESRQPATIREISFAGEFTEPPEENDVYLEFVGDSITCGYGLSSPANSSDVSHFWASRAYSYVCAEKLGADYSMVCISGYAITGKGSIPDILWPYTTWKRSPKPAYDFSRKPTALIINLGTNEAGGSDRAVTRDVFEAGVRSFIARARKDYRDDNLPIIFVYNMMTDGYQSTVLKVIKDLGGADAHLYSVQGVRDNSGASNHPNASAQRTTGERLAKFLQENILK